MGGENILERSGGNLHYIVNPALLITSVAISSAITYAVGLNPTVCAISFATLAIIKGVVDPIFDKLNKKRTKKKKIPSYCTIIVIAYITLGIVGIINMICSKNFLYTIVSFSATSIIAHAIFFLTIFLISATYSFIKVKNRILGDLPFPFSKILRKKFIDFAATPRLLETTEYMFKRISQKTP